VVITDLDGAEAEKVSARLRAAAAWRAAGRL
jgi:hypothetical protein